MFIFYILYIINMKFVKRILKIIVILYLLVILISRCVSSMKYMRGIFTRSNSLYTLSWTNMSVVIEKSNNYFYISLNNKDYEKLINIEVLDNNENKLDIPNNSPCVLWEEYINDNTGCNIKILTRESFFWMNEYKMPMCVSSDVLDDNIEINLWNRKWYYLKDVSIKNKLNEKFWIEYISRYEWLLTKILWLYVNLICDTWSIVNISVIK